MSKAYSLPGIRLGWIASRSYDVIDVALNHRSYTSISVGLLDQEVATYALDDKCIHNLLRRNIDMAKQNLAILESFIERHRWACDWVRPVASTLSFVRFSKMGKPVDDAVFCRELLEKKGVLVVPGSSCFGNDTDYNGYVRIGYGNKEALEGALAAIAEFLDEDYESVPVVKQLALR